MVLCAWREMKGVGEESGFNERAARRVSAVALAAVR